MKRGFIIWLVGSLTSLLLTSQVYPIVPMYTDDAYYWPTEDTTSPTIPKYDRNAREFIFIEDTIQPTDTVVMRIVHPTTNSKTEK